MRAQSKGRVALAALGVLVIVAPELMGGRDPRATTTIALMAALSGVAALVAWRSAWPTLREPAALGLGLAAAWCVVQTVPLPSSWVHMIAPASATSAEQAADLLGRAAPAWIPLSESPYHTHTAVLSASAVAISFAVAWAAARSGLRRDVLMLLAASVLCVAVIVVAHKVLDVRRPFGFLPEPASHPPFVGPLLNTNQLAGFLGAGVPLLIAFGAEERRRERKSAWFVAALGMSVLCVLCMSRGGVLSLLVGCAVLAIYAVAKARRRETSARWALPGAALVGIAATSAFVAVGDPMIAETRQGLPKLELIARALGMLPRVPWTGVGRGAFSVAFVRVQGTQTRFEYPENWLAQLLVELGPIVGTACIGLVAWSVWRGWRGVRSLPQVSALAAVTSLVVHDAFDFLCEAPGAAVWASALLATAVAPASSGRRASSEAVPSPTQPDRRRATFVAAVAPALACVVFAPSAIQRDVDRLEARARSALSEARREELSQVLTLAIESHPSEPVFPLLAAAASVAAGSANAGTWLNRVMELAPHWHEPHRLAAIWLAERGALEQAWLEVRQVRRIAPDQANHAACPVAAHHGSAAHAIRILDDDLDQLDDIIACPGLAPEDALAIDAYLAERGRLEPVLRRAQREIAAGNAATAISLLEGIEPDPPHRAEVGTTLARALVAARRAPEAVVVLRDVRAHHPSRDAVYELARAQAAAGDAEGMRATMESLPTVQTDPSIADLAGARIHLGDLERSLGNDGRAMRAYEEANRLDPSGYALNRVLDLATSVGDLRRAELARRELCRRDGPTRPGCDERGVLAAQPIVPMRDAPP